MNHLKWPFSVLLVISVAYFAFSVVRFSFAYGAVWNQRELATSGLRQFKYSREALNSMDHVLEANEDTPYLIAAVTAIDLGLLLMLGLSSDKMRKLTWIAVALLLLGAINAGAAYRINSLFPQYADTTQ